MSDISALQREFLLERELFSREARKNLLAFILFTMPEYQANWHHKHITKKLQEFWVDKKAKKLMLFVPPQHGKSQIASRHFPAWVLGRNPNTKIAITSYSADLAKSFNRDVKRLIKSEEYATTFPQTKIGEKGKDEYSTKTEEFQIVDKSGFSKAVGVTGGLSGRSIDLAIIDDPVKDKIEASSPTYRQRVWEWYVSVLATRLHNESKVLLIMTRWHEDDLAGRLLLREPEKWQVVKIPAIKESEGIKEDSRKIGEPLWPQKHNLEKLLSLKALSETEFEALYQQNPTAPEGNKVKKEWFEFCSDKELPGRISWDLWVDGAYTKRTSNDPTGLMITGYHKPTKTLYVKHGHDAFMEMPELLSFIPEYASLHDLSRKSRILIEPKASGKSLRQLLNSETDFSAVEIKSVLVQEGKEARIQTAAPKIESGKVVFVRGNWNDRVIHQITAFPNAAHDEYVDLIGYACDYYFKPYQKGISLRN